MKKYLLVYIVALCTLIGCKDNSGLYGLLTDYDLRISELEKLCEDINTNVQSIQVIIEAQQTGDYITAITPIKNGGVEIGYTITFAKHEPITIYHGQNGTNGTNGTDGHTPVIGVAKDTDGVYYWTLDGKWLLDSNGNKLRVTGQDGKDGQDGANGEDGEDGAKGDKGDKGDTGATGATGETGPKGEQGDSMFKSVTQDENYVYFTLADGTVIKIAKGSSYSENRIEGQLNGVFSVSKYDKVNFSQGNLLYNPALDLWRFANEQYICYLKDKTNISQMDSIWMDLFIWGSTGYRDLTPLVNDYKYYEFYSYEQVDIKIENYDWGVFCSIENGGNLRNKWRTLTSDEWIYLMEKRNNARNLRTNALVDNIEGIILLPDTSTIAIKNPNFLVDGLSYSIKAWQGLENQGCVFLPTDKYWTSSVLLRSEKYGTQVYYKVGMSGRYIDLTTCTIKTGFVGLYDGLDEFYHIRLVRNCNN